MIKLRFWLGVWMVLVSVMPAAAQRSPEGYLVGAAGGWTTGRSGGGLLGAAAGAEFPVASRLDVGGEASVLGGADGGLLILSLSVRGDLVNRTHLVVPFVVGGFSGLLSSDLSPGRALHIGGGIDYRPADRRPLRFEFRDIITGAGRQCHFWSFRVGMTFR